MAEPIEFSDLLLRWIHRAECRSRFYGDDTIVSDLKGEACWTISPNVDNTYSVSYCDENPQQAWLMSGAKEDVERFLAVELGNRVRHYEHKHDLTLPLDRDQVDPGFQITEEEDQIKVMERGHERATFPKTTEHDLATRFTHYAFMPLDDLIDNLSAKQSIFIVEKGRRRKEAVTA